MQNYRNGINKAVQDYVQMGISTIAFLPLLQTV